MPSPLRQISAAFSLSPVNEASTLLPKSHAGHVLDVHGTAFSTFTGTLCAMVGAGILTYPSTVASVPILLWVALLVVTVVLAHAALTCLTVACDVTGEYSYEGLVQVLCGGWMAAVLRGLTLLTLFGAAVLFMVLAVDLLTPLKALAIVGPSTIASVFALASIPLCLAKTLHALRYTNAVVVFAAFYIAGVLAWYVVQRWLTARTASSTSTTIVLLPQSKNNTWVSWATFDGVAYTVPLLMLGFSCPFNFVRSYGELVDKSSIGRIQHSLLFAGFALYMVASLAGFSYFDGAPPQDIVVGLHDDWNVTGIRIALSMCMLFKVPMTYQPFFETLQLTIPALLAAPRMRLIVALVYVFSAWAIALTAPTLSNLFRAMGTLGGIGLSYLVPGFFLWSVTQRSLWLPHRQYYQAMACMTMGAAGLLLVWCTLPLSFGRSVDFDGSM
ncbi:hypothetical protein H310_12460 [Aphanomyces invadans]|uniref:Amino acid transporter transmembrane domain-containing protein n=1 Tax=Aphanomyces invadans TaxID=157072 RepID=A0A024TI67_9STRA|nr:hypothetical protein H310_12460 [Aphanomyces invadans]ETV93694.1 hypothetical protein H310_12460 [Aphanomyces invadans]|eukprot:XP_008877735.1 hypothetical protein H310_12460 [Aphanomyces invadans]